MSPSLYLKDQPEKYLLVLRKDPYRRIVNPYFLERQQKNVAAGENCPYGQRNLYDIHTHKQHINKNNKKKEKNNKQTNKQKQNEENQTYLIEDNHQSATIPVHHRQQTNKQKHRYLMWGTDHFSVYVTEHAWN